MPETQYGLPLLVDNLSGSGVARGLKRIRFESGDSEGGYSERWLQKLISRYPNVLPIQQIEPTLTPAVPVCMELPVGSGFVDNLYATPDGGLIIGETKLFRNPEARRKVVGQIIDYAKNLSAMSYEKLEEAIFKAEAPDGAGGHPKLGLFGTVASACGGEEMDETLFFEAVSRNLERGRFLLLVIGDGIQAGAESMVEFLQQHAGMHFSFGLVELATFELPSEMGGYMVQPRVLARTKNIDRGIVTIDNGRITVSPPLAQMSGLKGITKRTTLSEEQFYEELDAKVPDVVSRLKPLTARLGAIGVEIDFGKDSMIFRWRPDDQRSWNLGTVTTSGKVWTDTLNYQADQVGLIHLSHAYLKRLASVLPGAYVKELAKPTSWYVAKAGTYVTVGDLLGHADEWLLALQGFMADATSALKDQ
ncbi:MAG TPA: hypothetical protein VEF06_16195 [Bryobacteraceae bacterium]|nr:hypothetical protein [Bryobacteraceae bacterium]